MKNLQTALNGKTLADLTADRPAGGSNLLEPTKTEIEAIMALLKLGKSHEEIKQTVRRFLFETRTRTATRAAKDADGNDIQEEFEEEYQHQLSGQGFSFGQLNEIERGMKAKIAELTPVPKDVEAS